MMLSAAPLHVSAGPLLSRCQQPRPPVSCVLPNHAPSPQADATRQGSAVPVSSSYVNETRTGLRRPLNVSTSSRSARVIIIVSIKRLRADFPNLQRMDPVQFHHLPRF